MNLPDLDGTVIKCREVGIREILLNNAPNKLYPYLVSNDDTGHDCVIATPLHGRSVIVEFNPFDRRYTITKGNGLTYFPYGYISTGEFETHTWGLLNTESAERDYYSCNFVSSLGILTNKMEAVFTLEDQKINCFDKIITSSPTILQYSVICPYRIADIPFMSRSTVNYYTSLWNESFDVNFKDKHCIFAYVILKNIRIMHENDVLQNSINQQNISLSLELLDFEVTRTPVTPYNRDEDEKTYKNLMKREVIHVLEIVNQIAYYLGETVNIKLLTEIMKEAGYEKYIVK
jgi:hypothetical protein